MTISIGAVMFDTRDAQALAAWWTRQTDATTIHDDGGPFVFVRTPAGLTLGFQTVPDPTPGKNRVHVDVHAADREAEVARLLGDGATLVARHELDGFPWVVLADPEGNQFCVTEGE